MCRLRRFDAHGTLDGGVRDGIEKRGSRGRSFPLLAMASSPEGGLCDGIDPIAGHVFERLWLYLFLEDDEVDETVRRFTAAR